MSKKISLRPNGGFYPPNPLAYASGFISGWRLCSAMFYALEGRWFEYTSSYMRITMDDYCWKSN